MVNSWYIIFESKIYLFTNKNNFLEIKEIAETFSYLDEERNYFIPT